MEIPGYTEALAAEEAAREESFLGVAAPIGGVPVVPLTLRRLTFLFRGRSPFFYGGALGPEAVAQFLWIVSPKFRPADLDARALFLAEISTSAALADLAAAEAEIETFIALTFGDAPASQAQVPGADKPPVTCFAASIVDTLAAEYGWGLDAIMDAPLACIYGLLRRIALRRDPKAIFISCLSHKVRGDWLRSLSTQSGQMPSTRADADNPDHDSDEKQPDE